MKRLSEEDLKRKPEEVFDFICKLGEGSYGSVYKAVHKELGEIVAIKQVPLEASLNEIIQEISAMQQCESEYVVKYYGSYFRDNELLIVMEFCCGGSVSDIMRLRRKTLAEDEIAPILRDTLRGLQYLHEIRKIHRDIKAGNILLNFEGNSKLADFGVAGQLTDTMTKRNTVIGTPFWMAPEVIQETGYNTTADIWSLGITALEMAEGRPPYADIHPMRAIFMIPSKPPPTFQDPQAWSPEFVDLVSRCLVKDPDERATASELLQHDFIKNCKSTDLLANMIEEAKQIREEHLRRRGNKEAATESDDETDSGTIVRQNRTLRLNLAGNDATIISPAESAADQFRTMIINNENENDAEESTSEMTMKRHDTAVVAADDKPYRPSFLDHFEQSGSGDATAPVSLESSNDLAGKKGVGNNGLAAKKEVQSVSRTYQPIRASGTPRLFQETDFDFLKFESYDSLHMRMMHLDEDMAQEIEELQRRYQLKRLPILEAMQEKKLRKLNF